jgi:oxygen-dependent protoporphyrinogen oxidase
MENRLTAYDIETLVVGGGIAGLACAVHLKGHGRTVRLVERNDQLGGVIRTLEEAGYQIETGPNSLFLRPEDPLLGYLHQTGLDQEVVLAGQAGKRRFILKDGKSVPLPGSILEGITTPVLSVMGKIRVLREAFIPPYDPNPPEDPEVETVAHFVERRFGSEFLEWIIDPFVKGVFASTPETLSMEDTFPRLTAMEDRYGSVLRGALAMQFGPKPPRSPLTRSIFSFKGGMGRLPKGLSGLLGTDAGTNAEVVGITQTPNGFRTALLFEEETYYLHSRHVVLAGNAIQSSELLQEICPEAVGPMTEIPYAPIAVISLGFSRKNVEHSLDGFGLLVPSREKRKILGILFSSSLFPDRAPEGQVLLTVFAGGMSNPKLAFSFDDDLIEIVGRDVETILGTKGKPDFLRIQRWEGAIPQYTPGHRSRIERMTRALPNGLYLAGSYLSGVSVSQSFTSGIETAKRILASPPES